MLDVVNCYLMAFIDLKTIVFIKIEANFLNMLFFVLLSNCYRALLWSGHISFLVKYKFICLVSVLSDAVLILLITFFSEKNGH